MKSNKLLLTGAIGFVFALYPLLVYFGLQRFEPRIIAACFLLAAIIKLAFLIKNKATGGNSAWLILAAATATGLTLWTGSLFGLKSYPILVNTILFVVFCSSLWQQQTTIERFARLQDPNLPDSGIAYTRKVTKIWCVFFILNGTLSAATLFGSDQLWALYNGLIAYILIGLLLAGEYIVRRRVMARHQH